MLSLGIYGPSFAEPRTNPVLEAKGWPNLLKQHYVVMNYSLGGADLWTLYKEFVNTHKNYDKVVFISPSRQRCFNGAVVYDGTTHSFTGVQAINIFRKKYKELPEKINRKLIALEYYYNEIEDRNISYEISGIINEKILSIRPDVLMLFVRPNNFFPNDPRFTNKTLLMDYQRLFVKSVNPSFISNYEQKPGCLNLFNTNMVCHLSEEVNVVLAEHVKEALDKGVWNPTIPDTIPHAHTWEWYTAT
jgi:hypothetical protein